MPGTSSALNKVNFYYFTISMAIISNQNSRFLKNATVLFK